MRTKTLLIAAAALAVGVASSLAQTYSQNVVGYYNVTIAAGKYYILANQLINGSDPAQTNNDINTVFNSGLASDAAGPPNGNNAQLLVWNGVGYVTYYYLNAADAVTYNGAGSTAGWVDNQGNPVTGVYMNQGLSAFVYNPSGSPMTATVVGTVLQGTNNVISIAANNYGLYSIAQPVSTNADASPIGIGGLSSDPAGPPNGNNDQLLVWNGVGYVTYYYLNGPDAISYNGAGSTAGFVDNQGNPVQVNLNVGQGFFLKHFGAALEYTNVFNVQ